MALAGAAFLGATLAGCGDTPPSPVRDVTTLGSTGVRVVTVPQFIDQTVWWQTIGGSWHHTPVEQPTASMPLPLRESLTWADELSQGEWPGGPVPPTWAAWAGHVGPPLGWVVWPEPPNHGPAHPVSIELVLPEKAPYSGYGKFYTFWEDTRTGWKPFVSEPLALPPKTNLNPTWHTGAHIGPFNWKKYSQ